MHLVIENVIVSLAYTGGVTIYIVYKIYGLDYNFITLHNS